MREGVGVERLRLPQIVRDERRGEEHRRHRLLESLAPRRRPSPAVLAGFAAVVLVRVLTLPRSLWEMDEVLFARAVEHFDPLSHRPHPPGYPLLVGLGKAFNLVFHDPFVSLVALSFVSSLVGYAALVAAFRRIAGEGSERVAVAGALLFHLSPAMLVQAPLPMSVPEVAPSSWTTRASGWYSTRLPVARTAKARSVSS